MYRGILNKIVEKSRRRDSDQKFGRVTTPKLNSMTLIRLFKSLLRYRRGRNNGILKTEFYEV